MKNMDEVSPPVPPSVLLTVCIIRIYRKMRNSRFLGCDQR